MSIGPWQAMLVLLIVLILFGAGKLPNVMHDLGHGLRNFKKAMHENEEDNNLKKTDPNNAKKQ
ncbi:Sec-independent protein translocase protein TatA [Candidatus Xenohaliotis californiensis]|uniref:Sec-independent protein translocase protein TatA n=1 Tax=Candidatus Xenohaliotis californiensis TaxID=84677 RepID=A0ABP0EUC7_9RICK|nr:Sec-independent protein translocase protein TatA [Candidatus Xenohaliotis californiensis]